MRCRQRAREPLTEQRTRRTTDVTGLTSQLIASVTPLNRYVGYENAAKVAKTALAEQKTIREVVLEQGYVERGDLTESQLDEALDVLSMTRP